MRVGLSLTWTRSSLTVQVAGVVGHRGRAARSRRLRLGCCRASGVADPSPYDPRDASFAAAAKLANDGVDQDPAAAIYSYNDAVWYVALVTAWATAYGYFPSASLGPVAVLNHPNLRLRAKAAADVRSARSTRESSPSC